MDRPRPVHLDPDRPVLDRRFKKNYVRKKSESDERSFLYREQLVCVCVCLCVPQKRPKNGSRKGFGNVAKKSSAISRDCPTCHRITETNNTKMETKCAKKSSACDRIRDIIDSKSCFSQSATLPTKFCDECLIGFKRVLVLGKIYVTRQSDTCISRCRR